MNMIVQGLKPVFFGFGFLLLALFVWIMLGGIRYERATSPTLPMTNSATAKGQDPWMVNEKYQVGARQSARKSALAALDQSSGAMCSEDGRRKLISGVSYYYEMRGGQELGYPRSWGEGAGVFIRQAWATSEDSRIERMTQEIYSRGFFKLGDFRPAIGKRIGEVVAKERVTGKPCA